MNGKEVAVIIVAAGSGSRFGGDVPKQFCLLEGHPVLMHSIERFARMMPEAGITVVLSADRVGYWKELCEQYDFHVSHNIAIGGATRWESVKNALETINPTAGTVLIHDGARPLVSAKTVANLCDAVKAGAEGALPVLPMVDSLRELDANGESKAVDRSRYVAVQTPQAFPTRLLQEAYRLPYTPVMTDDASVMEHAGHTDIRLVAGNAATLKITRSEDMDIAVLYLRRGY